MRQRSQTLQDAADGWSFGNARTERPEVVGSEDIHVRNYDHQWGYDLTLEVFDADGEAVLETRYYLPPGQFESEINALPAGRYAVQATLDNRKDASAEVRIDTDVEHTLVVEVGNGALSLTEGLNA
ncbi:MAG: hypothetical protein ABEH59_01415 [Halobacteriales archaeon]